MYKKASKKKKIKNFFKQARKKKYKSVQTTAFALLSFYVKLDK